MKRVVADTGPIHYLTLTGDIWVLPRLFDVVLIPTCVRDELAHPVAPTVVRDWIGSPPPWLQIHPMDKETVLPEGVTLDRGERAAIELAIVSSADTLLMDDRDGVAFARSLGIAVTGTLGLLDLAARNRLLELASAFERLKSTSFYYRRGLMEDILARHESGQT